MKDTHSLHVICSIAQDAPIPLSIQIFLGILIAIVVVMFALLLAVMVKELAE